MAGSLFLDGYKRPSSKKDDKKKDEKKTVAKKPQSSSVSKVNNNASKSTFMGGGAPVQKVQQTVKQANNKPKTVKTPPTREERINQKMYGTTKPNVTVKTSAEKRQERETRRQAAVQQKMTGGIDTSAEARAKRNIRAENRRAIGQAQKNGDYDRASQLRGPAKEGSRRAKIEQWDKDIADTITHTIKQGLAADARMVNLGMKGITQKDAFLYTTPEQRRKADEKVARRDEKLGKRIETETKAIQDIQDKHGYVGRQALSAVSSATGMGMDIAAGAVVPGSSLFHMWSRSTGTSLGEVNKKADNLRKQLKATGQYSDDELDNMFRNVNGMDLANAAASGGIEVLSELLFPGVGAARKVIGGKGMSIAERAGAKLFNRVGAKASSGLLKNLTRGTLEEVAEEEVGGPLQALTSNLIYGNRFQRYNEDALKKSLANESNALRSNIRSDADARATAARLSSQAFMDESIKAYMDSGYSKKEATRLAEMSRDYLTASLSGDVDSMKKHQDAMVKMMAGGENSMKEKFTFRDAIDAAVSTSMMTMVTGAPAAFSTMQAGNAYKESVGLDAVKQQAEMIKNWGEPKDKAKAQAVIDHIDIGGDLSGTQVYEIVQKAGEIAEKNQEPEQIKNRVAQVEMTKRDLRISPVNPDGSLAPQTAQRYVQIVNDAISRHESLARIGEEKGVSSDEVAIGAEIGAAFRTGVIDSEMVNELARGSETVRSVFREVTGVDVDQFDSYTEMRDSLMAKAADNMVNSARIEQVAWNDESRKQVSDYLTQDMKVDGQGVIKIQNALQSVDPRDRTQFLMMGDVARNVYDYGRYTDSTWNEAAQRFKSMYPSLDTKVLKDVFNAAKADKDIAETAYYGKVVTSGKDMNKSSVANAETAMVPGRYTDKRTNKEGATLSEESLLKSFVTAFGINIDVVDDLGSEVRDKDGNIVLDDEGLPVMRQDNGAFIPATNTLVLNANADTTRTITQTAVHELTHHIAVHAPDEYVKLSRYIMDAWYKQDAEGFNRAIKSRQALYKAQKNQELSPEQALEEIIADGSADFNWADEDFIAEVTTKEPTLASKIIDAIKEVLRKLRNILASGDVIDEASQEALYSKVVELDTVRSMWVKAAQTARQAQADQAIDEWQDEANKESKYSVAEDKWENDEKLTKAKFNSFYSAHKLTYGRATKENVNEVIDKIKSDGFISTTAIANVVPASINDYVDPEKPNLTQSKYGAKEGDVVMFVPNKYVDLKNDIIKNGYKPRDYEIVEVERDYQPYYELYSKAYDDAHQTRFSVSEPVERVKDLIAVHNLKPDDIRNTFELGGFPMPSIAITKDSMGHDMYGDISLLFGSDTIDPKFFRSNQVFGGDAYTPTFPATQYKPNEDIVEKFRDIYYDNAKTLGYDAMRPFYELAEDAENALNRNGGEQGLIDRYKNDVRAMRTFLKINGKDVEDVVKRTEDTISETEQKLRQHFIDTLGEDAIREFEGESIPHGKAMMDHRKNWTYEHSDEIKSAYRDFLNREFSFSDEEISNVLDNMNLFETMKLVRNALNYLNNGPTTVKEEVDRAATDKAIEDAAHELGYEEWIDGLLTGIEEKRGIRNDKEFFTRNGNRRSWDTLHDDITLENVVKAMRSELAAGGNGFLWKNPKGAAQKQYKSLDEIRADEDRLQQLPEEEYKSLEQAATQKLSDVLSDVVDNNPGRFMNSFGAVLDTGEYIAEILNETRDKDTMQRKLKKDYSLEVSDEQMNRIAEAIEEIANIPTGYFEAKPRRAVGFDEVKAAIIPNSLDADIREGLSERGVNIYEYDPEVEGDRTQKINDAASENDLRFSISNKYDDAYMDAVNSGNMDEAQRLVDEAAKMAGYTESLYHGTGEYFNIFKMGREGIHLGNIDQAKQVSKNRYHDRSKTTRYTYDEVLNNYEKLDHDAKLKLAAAADRAKWHHTSLVFRDSLPDFDTENFTDDELKKYVKAVSDEYEKNNVYPLGFELPTFDRKVGENLMHLYAKISNPFVIENDLLDWTPSYIAEVLLQRAEGKTNMDGRFEMYGGGFDMDISGSEFNPDDMGRMDLQRLSGGLVKGDQAWRLLEEVLYWNGGYDGIKYLNKYEGDKNSYSYIALKPSDVKSADPVTYDDNGNVIPLSERFNQESPDIRWSVSPEQIEKAEADIGPMVRFSTPTYREIQPKAIYKSGVGFADYFKDASGRDLTYEWTKNNFSKEQADAVVAYLDKMAEWFEQSGEGSLRARYRFIGWDDLTNASVQVKTNDAGEIVGVTVSAMVKNGEYPVNFDLTTVCNKREGITNVIKNLIDKKVDGESVLHSIKLTDENMWKINQALKKENIDTACLGCFVEARRYYAQRFMDKIEDKWNKAVRQARKELGLPENEYFDFAKGRAVTGEEWSSIDSLWTAYDESTESKSSPADRIKILMDEIVKNKDVNSPYLKQIRISDILTPEGINGFKQLSNKGHDMVKTIKSIYGTSAPKEILAFTPYNSEIALLPTEMKGLPTGEYLKSIGGIRVQSFSDFKIAHVFEHFQMVADEAARNFYTHGYSKVIAFPRIFGLTGRKINMSVMFDVLNNKAWSQALGIPVRKAAKYAKKYQGLQFVKELPKENKDNRPYKEVEIEGVHGYLTYLVSDADYVNSIFGRDYRKNIEAGMSEDEARRKANESKPYEQSINYREAVELENQDGYKENVGIIAVAYGDEHLKMLLSDPNVRYIIPYHKSGLPTFISKKTALAIARDYTNFQNTNIAESWKDKNGKDIDLKKEYEAFKQESKAKYPAIEFFKQINDNKYKVKFGSKSAAEKASMAGTADFDVYEPLETAKDIREVSNAYLEHCIEKGWCPIFHEFAGDPNYYKMLFDFAVTDGSFNNIYPQRTVRNRYPGLDIDAKVAAGEQITDEDLVELKKAVEMGAETENRKNMTMAQNMPNVMNDILTRGSENSIIDDTNLNSIRWDTPDYTDVKLGNEEMTPAEEPGDIRRSIAVNFDDAYMDAVNNENPTENPDIRHSIAPEQDVNNYVNQATEDINDIPLNDPSLEQNRQNTIAAAEAFEASISESWGRRNLNLAKGTPLKNQLIRLMKQVRKDSGTERQYKTETLDATIKSVENMYKSATANNAQAFAKEAWDAAERIVNDIDFNDDLYQQYKGITEYFSHNKISPPVELLNDEEFNKFLQDNAGKIRFTYTPSNALEANEDELDLAYRMLSRKYPEFFPADINHPIDQLVQMSAVLANTDAYRDAYTSEEHTKLVEDIANNLCDIVSEGTEYQAAINEINVQAMKQRHEEALRKARTERDAIADRERQRANMWKQRYNERIKNEQAKKKEKADKREHLKSFGHIEENYNKLCTWVLKPTKEKNVPEEFRKALAEFLQALDLQTENSKKLEAKTGRVAQKTLRMRELKDRLNDLASRKEGDGSSVWEVDESIAFLLGKLSDKLDENGNSIDSLDAEDIKTIDVFMKLLMRNIERYKQVKTETKMAEISNVGGRGVEFFKAKVDRDGEFRKRKGLRGTLSEINATALTPAYLFDRLGPLKEMYDVLRHNGFDTYIRNEKMITDKLTEILGSYYKTNKKGQNMPGSIIEEWRDERSAQDIELSNGKTITMSVAQMMSLRCLVKRGEQAMGHMMVGGIVVTPIQTTSKLTAEERTQKGRVEAALTRAKRGAKNAVEARTKGVDESTQKYVLSYEDIQTIMSKLTAEQAQIADKLQELMSVDMAKLGNEAHRELYGYDMFGEDNYFPIKVHGNERATDINNIGDVIEKIKSFGFTKPLTPRAGQAIEIDDIFSVVADHCNGMNLYNSYLVPITDFMKVLNYTHTFENGDSLTMKEAIEQAYGKDMLKYILNLMKDINGIKESSRGGLESIMNKALGRAKRTAVFGNIRVALQQPTAIVRALVEINPKYFKGALSADSAKAFIPENVTATMEEMYKYCPIAQWKAWGYYDTYMGRDIEDVMMNTWSVGDKLLAGYYGQLDNATWSMIWQAVKAEQADKHKGMDTSSEEFLQLCGRRASEVFDKTQVVDSTFHRSDAMRSKQIATKLFTAFMAEPTLTLNVFRAGLYNSSELRKEGKKGEANKVFGRAIGTIALQAAIVSAAQAFADAWRGKDPGLPWGDDDDDEEKAGYWWRWIHNFVYNLIDQAHLENNMYLVKDVTPYLNYMASQAADYWNLNPTLRAILGWDQDYLYSQNNLVFAGLENTANGIAQAFKKLEKGDEYVDYNTKEPKRWYDINQKIASGIGTFIGFPGGTLMRDFKPVWDFIIQKTFAADTNLMDNIANKMGYQKAGSSDVGSKTTSEESGQETDSADIESDVEEYRNSLSDNFSEEEKDELVKQYEKRIKKGVKSAEEQEKRDYDTMLYDAMKASAGLEGEEHDKKIWQSVSKGYKAYVEEGNYERINMMRRVVEEAGGDVNYFDKQVNAASKVALKKSLKPVSDMTEEEYYAQKSILGHLRQSGMPDEEISNYIYDSEARKDLQVAMRINDEDAIFEELTTLVGAGFTDSDFEKAYKNRNRVDLKAYKENGGKYADRLKSMGTFIWPATGVITSHFGYRNAPTAGASSNHPAIDIGVPVGTPVAAADGGVVIYAGHNSGYGNSVGIKHDNGMVTYYNHLDSWNVKVGDTVAQGQQIACSGNTGISTGPHLDFKIMDTNGKPVDPEKYLN